MVFIVKNKSLNYQKIGSFFDKRSLLNDFKIRGKLRFLFAFILPMQLTACSLAPSIPYFGAAFPSWLYCVIGGFVLTTITELFIVKMGWKKYITPMLISYFGFLVIYTTLVWFILF